MDLPPFVAHCLELLSPLGPVRARRMFGGWGLYADGLFVAIIAAERLYLKTDADTRGRFSEAGCEPFVYGADGRSVTLGYWTAPPEALDSPALMSPWARLALQAALAARAGKSGTQARKRAAGAEMGRKAGAPAAARRRRLG